MNYDVGGIGSSVWCIKPFKRKRGVHHHRVCSNKSPTCKTAIRDQLQNQDTVADVAPNPLCAPNFGEGGGHGYRYNPFSICKMVRLAKSQTNFLCQCISHKAQGKDTQTFEALSHHIGACGADPTSTDLAFFYLATETIRGTCIAKQKRRKCVVLGMEYRTNSSSFRLYLAYFSKFRLYMICYTRFLIKQLLPSALAVLVPLIIEYCFHGLVHRGFEIVGAHYLDPMEATGKPKVSMAKPQRTRHFTSMWNNNIHGIPKDGINFLIKHARRDVQVFELRVESKMYNNLICGKP